MPASVLSALARGGSGPLIVVEGQLLLANHDAGGAGELTTAGDQRLQLHPRGSYAAFHRHQLRLHANEIGTLAAAELTRQHDPLEAFIAVADRYRRLSVVSAEPPAGAGRGVQSHDPTRDVLDALIARPPPPVPDPCVIDVVDGHGVYPLAADRRAGWFIRRPHVVFHGRRLCAIQDAPLPVAVLDMAAEADLEEALWSARSTARGLLPPCPPGELARARAEIGQTGAVRRGSLLWLAAPRRLGHLLPSGFRTQGRISTGTNLAVTIPWPGRPLDPSHLRPYGRLRSGHWEQVPLPPNGVCLGPGPAPGQVTSPGPLTAALYLQWAAGRVASNQGKWHE
jgi:hypothetical protein